MGIKSLIARGAQHASDAIASVSSLSPKQLKDIDNIRTAYLTEQPDPSDTAAVELTRRLIASCGIEIHNSFLNQINQVYAPVDPSAEYAGKEFDAIHNIRSFEVTRWVIDPDEKTLDKLINVYEVLSNSHCNIALIFNRTKSTVHVYFAVVDTNNSMDNVDVNSYCRRLRAALRGNFPGSEISKETTCGQPECISNKRPYSVACISNIPTEKSEEFVSQTVEKLLDGFVPHTKNEEYTLILLANPVQDIQLRKLHLSELYSALSPYKSWQTNYTYTESNATSSTATFGINAGVSAGMQNGSNTNVSSNTNETHSNGSSQTNTSGNSETFTDGRNQSTTGSVSLTESAKINAGVGEVGLSATESLSTTAGTSSSHSLATNVSRAITQNIGRALTRGISSAHGSTNALNLGVNFGANFARSSTITATIGKNEGITQSFTNYTIHHTLELLEAQMKRLEQASAMGMWDFAAYVLSEDADMASNVAYSYLSLTQGKESYLSSAAINHWRGDRGEYSKQAQTIYEYLRVLRHPLFTLNPSILNVRPDFSVYPAVVTATTMLSGRELAYSLNFPKHSVPGLPVVECVAFGRDIAKYDTITLNDRVMPLGKIFHMHNEESTTVELSIDSLTSHTFIAGSTGTGKTNTICHMLDVALESGIPFLVIEPSKGEYKDIFGAEKDVMVFGTNPRLAPLLHINPFSFPDGIHVLEHLDRLVEVFTACWPMYAAMPAVLKEAVERSYLDCGWNLTTSTNEYGADFFPSFSDVARNVKTILDISEYDAENKGAYKGSLLTRLRSLTNGINGVIFSQVEISSRTLFDQNVIVDLSRVGSTETKALFMGMLVLKLQEYRMASSTGTNLPLCHFTVLEEAHNLLRKAPAEQTSESGNLFGKSVEMLANAIAEMRTYGEGFVIADQAPGLLDMSVIRNTNTKIIMRMPDFSDRELVGRAANLTDSQIVELARLPRGVAAVYQNDWIQPVLCKIEKSEKGKPFIYHQTNLSQQTWNQSEALEIIRIISCNERITDEARLRDIRLSMQKLGLSCPLQIIALQLLQNLDDDIKMTKLAPIISGLFPKVYEAVKSSYARNPDTFVWTEVANSALNSCIQGRLDDNIRTIIIQGTITQYVYNELCDIEKLREWSNFHTISNNN